MSIFDWRPGLRERVRKLEMMEEGRRQAEKEAEDRDYLLKSMRLLAEDLPEAERERFLRAFESWSWAFKLENPLRVFFELQSWRNRQRSIPVDLPEG